MNKSTSITLAIVLLTLAPVGLAAQETTMYAANPLRLDLRVLGQPPLDVIPPGESAITSLVVGADGNLYGGTSGNGPTSSSSTRSGATSSRWATCPARRASSTRWPPRPTDRFTSGRRS